MQIEQQLSAAVPAEKHNQVPTKRVTVETGREAEKVAARKEEAALQAAESAWAKKTATAQQFSENQKIADAKAELMEHNGHDSAPEVTSSKKHALSVSDRLFLLEDAENGQQKRQHTENMEVTSNCPSDEVQAETPVMSLQALQARFRAISLRLSPPRRDFATSTSQTSRRLSFPRDISKRPMSISRLEVGYALSNTWRVSQRNSRRI